MSGYPPYPPHQQGSGYPQPYQATTPLSYPLYPGSAAPPGQISGYPSYPAAPGYPSSQPAPYPPTQSSYPPTQSPYPSTQSSYPPTQSSYPPTQSSYPPTQSSYPPTQSSYTPTQSSYPSTQSSYPPTQSPYPPTQSPYPPTQGSSYPPTQSLYPAAGSSPYPSNQAPYPGQGHGPGSHPHAHAPHHPPQFGGAAPGGQPMQAYYKGTPTVRPAHPFDPRQDAEVLRTAMKGFGTDEKAIIQVLTKRTNAQRQEIALQFKTMYGKDLISNLKSELSGNFENLIVALMTPTAEYQAKELHHALGGVGTNESTLVELLCSATNQEIRSMCATYQHLFGHSLEQDLSGDTSGSFRRLLVSLCQGRRSENYIVDHHQAVVDAQALLRAGEIQLGTDESVFNMVLCERSYPQLIQVFMEYQRVVGHGIEKAVKGEFSGDIENGLLAIIKSVKDKGEFFADQLHESMAGAGTRDRALIRITTLRSEIDMEDIKRAFSHKYGKSLAEFIKDDTSGDYKKCLLALINHTN